MSKPQQQSFDILLSQDEAILASLALPRNPLAGAIFAGHHLWWKGNDVVEELARVENEAVPKKASFLQYGTSSSLSNLSQGLHAEVAWNSGKTLEKDDMYLGLKTINNKIDDDKQYFKTIFSATIPLINKAATESLEKSKELLKEYIGSEQDAVMATKTLEVIKGVETGEDNLFIAYWKKQAGELEILTKAQDAVIKAYASLQDYDEELTEFFSLEESTLIEEKEIDAGKVPFAKVDLEEYETQLGEYETTISNLKAQIKKMGIAERALEEKVRNLREKLITADQSHLKILAKRKDLSTRYANYVKGSRKRMAEAKEKIRVKMQKAAKEAAEAAEIHANGLENLLKACEAHVAALESEQKKGTEEAKGTMQRLLDEVEKVQEKEKSNKELKKQNKLLTQEAGEAQRFAEINEKKAEEARLESQKNVKNMELKLNEEKTKAQKEEELNRALEKKNVLLTQMTTELQGLVNINKTEVAAERARHKQMVETLTLENEKLNEEAEAAATEDKKQDTITEKKEEVIELLVEQINIIPAPTSIISKPKHGPSTAKIISKNWIFPITKQDAIESVFHLDQRLQNNTINKAAAAKDANKITLWSLIYDGVGLEQDFKKRPMKSIYMDPPRPSTVLTVMNSPKYLDDIAGTNTVPTIFYAPEGNIRIQILVPSRFILAKGKKPPGATGPHVLIGFSVYLQILEGDDSVSSFFVNLELKHNEVTKNLLAKAFYPTKSVLEITETGITNKLDGQLASKEVVYSGNQQKILETIKSSGTWQDVRGHVTRVYLHGDASRPIKKWTTFRQAELKDSNGKYYRDIEGNLQKWLTLRRNSLSFVTTTDIVGVKLTETIDTKMPGDSGKWLRQSSFTATPEFW